MHVRDVRQPATREPHAIVAEEVVVEKKDEIHERRADGILESDDGDSHPPFQNRQSEFLAMLAIVLLSIRLRQGRSPESMPVHAGHTDAGPD
jgi:hypothetical protein